MTDHASDCTCEVCGLEVAAGHGPIYTITGEASAYFSAIGAGPAYSVVGIFAAYTVDGCTLRYVVGDQTVPALIESIVGDCIVGDAVMGG